MNSTNILELILLGESQTVEFKSSFNRETIESLVAFANSEGGTIIIGVSDEGTVVGITVGKETLNEWIS